MVHFKGKWFVLYQVVFIFIIKNRKADTREWIPELFIYKKNLYMHTNPHTYEYILSTAVIRGRTESIAIIN